MQYKKLSLNYILKLFLNISKFEPQCSYKLYSYKKCAYFTLCFIVGSVSVVSSMKDYIGNLGSDISFLRSDVKKNLTKINRMRHQATFFSKNSYKNSSERNMDRSSHRRCSVKGAFRNFAKFTEKHLCQSLFFNKVPSWDLHRCFPVNFAKFLRTFYSKHWTTVSAWKYIVSIISNVINFDSIYKHHLPLVFETSDVIVTDLVEV